LPIGRERTTGNQNDDHSLNLDVVGDCGVEPLSDGEAVADGLSSRLMFYDRTSATEQKQN
jgi:hypothetical protein